MEEDLDEFGPVVSRRLHRARRLAQVGTIAGIGLIVALLLSVRRLKSHRRTRRDGCCSSCRGKKRRR
ncbi:MAG TPA: hypothetical protein VII83_08010, partial [Gaiellaceae bacterium]